MAGGTRRLKWIAPAAFAAAIFYLLSPQSGASGGTVVTFLGGAGEVGGSCHMVETGTQRFIVDCGALGREGVGVLPKDPSTLSLVILTHGHSDHCGLLPELFEAGFKGAVYCTEPTAAIVPVMLRMSRNFSKDRVSKESFESSITSFTTCAFGEWTRAGDVAFRFRRAGHLLGAAFVELAIDDGGRVLTVVFSGDLGTDESLLLQPMERCARADYVIIESTYGGVTRPGAGSGPAGSHDAFGAAVAEALERGGDVLVPAFTLGRTQEVIAALDLYSRSGLIPPGTEIFADSPTAEKISDIYRNFPSLLSEWATGFYGGRILRSPGLREVGSKTSMKVHSRKHRPAVFISSSGDLGHANSPRHFMRMCADSLNLLCLVGYQPPGSIGRQLEEGRSPVLVRHQEGKSIEKDWVAPAIRIRRFNSFSSHADQAGLIDWLSDIDGLKKVFIVHGEKGQSEALGSRVKGDLGIEVEIPARGGSFVLR